MLFQIFLFEWEFNWKCLARAVDFLLIRGTKSVQKTPCSCHSWNSEINRIVSEKHIYFLISKFKGCHEPARDVGLHLAELWYDLTNMWKFTVGVHIIRWTVYNPLILLHWKQLNRTDKHIWTVQSSHLNDTILLLFLYVEDIGAPLLTTE